MILLITGPAGAGKSTTSKEFLASVDGVWAYLSQDELRQQVKSGYASADDYEYNWSEQTKNQWQVSIPICCDLARRYDEVGINSLIDFNASPEEFKDWQKYLEGLDYLLVVLMPSEEIVTSRNASRENGARLKNNKILQNYEKLNDWNKQKIFRIDNSRGTVDETVDQINRWLSNF